MTIRYHPSDPVLVELAAGTLDAASALVVRTHLALCPACRRAVGRYEAVGGVMLADATPTPMKPGARAATLARLDDAEPVAESFAVIGGEHLPAPLAGQKLGSWRWIGRGVHWRAVDLGPAAGDTRAFMLRAAPGTRLPHHRHAGKEWTLVLQGAFQHDFGRYAAGDFDEVDEENDVDHRPVVATGETCICLVAMQGTIELQGWLGRLLQPLVRL